MRTRNGRRVGDYDDERVRIYLPEVLATHAVIERCGLKVQFGRPNL